MKKIVIFLVLTFCIASLFSAFSLNGRKWFSSPAFYYTAANGPKCCLTASQQQSATQGGLNAWSILSYGGTTGISGARADGVNVISWAKLGGTTPGVTSYITIEARSKHCIPTDMRPRGCMSVLHFPSKMVRGKALVRDCRDCYCRTVIPVQALIRQGSCPSTPHRSTDRA